jgi:hypothetical protein
MTLIIAANRSSTSFKKQKKEATYMNFFWYVKEDLRKKKQNDHCLAFIARASAT